jgi:outer membrane protein assembly factor BamB
MASLMMLVHGGLSGNVLLAADQPQWGERWTRNLVSNEKHLPDRFDPVTGLNIRWRAKLGTQTHSTPMVANGRVYIGTNNEEPRDPKHQGDRGVLMCFDEATGAFVWQLVVPKLDEDRYFDWPQTGMSSSVTIDRDRVYVVSNRGEVLCLDPQGMANGNDGPYRDEGSHMVKTGQASMMPGSTDADIIWKFDMVAGVGIWPHDGAHSAILVDGNYLYVNTGTGVDNTHKKIRTPDAPALIVLDKRTGRLVARDQEQIAPNTFHANWSSPSLVKVGGRKTVFFAGGNGIVYGFEALSGTPSREGLQSLRKVWQFDIDPDGPKEDVHRFNSNRSVSPSNIYGMPVVLDDRLYIAGGGDIWWGKTEAWLKCVDVRGESKGRNPEVFWSYSLPKHTMTTAAVYNGMVFASDTTGTLHCVDALTGKPLWTHEVGGETWASPYVADGKVYLGTRRGNFAVLAASREKQLLSAIDLHQPISATVTAANGTFYVATMTDLYRIGYPAPLR